jgi:serine/threonine protein kinase
MSDLEGVILSDYLLLQCVSKGGVADVYRARQSGESEQSNYDVAVKVFRPGFAQRASFRDYFMTEAEKIGQFDHPNILPLLEYGEGEDLLYVVTPFVTMGTLEELLRKVGGRFSAMQALPILQQLCGALQYAHLHDVTHGNIKPSNVFVGSDGRMLLADFGIARGYDDSQQSLTRVGWGSAEYAAPEQSLGVLRRSSDVYSLGVLLFRILTGSPPFTGQTPVEVLLKHVRQQPPSARSLVPNISDAVDGVLRMALQKRSDDRFASAEEFGNAFFAAVTVAPVASPVAKPVVPVTLPLSASPASSAKNPQTPLPPLNPYPIVNSSPQTPVPVYLALNPAALPPPTVPDASELSSAVSSVGDTVQPTPSMTRSQPVTSSEDATEIRRKNLLQESDEKEVLLFRTVVPDPPEWSPLAKEAPNDASSAVPLTASEYLEQKPAVTETSESVQTLGPLSVSDEPDKSSRTFGTLLHQMLPVIVVILLLLGLAGALLSSFLYK